MLKEEDDLSWYARKADALRQRIAVERSDSDADRAERVLSLLEALRRGGIKGSVERRTLYTRRLPPGCRSCLAGKGTNAYVTGLCTRDCFFCFNSKPRTDELVVHGIRLSEPEDAPEVVRRYGLRSVGVSGGEPTMRRDRLLRLVRALRTLPFPVRIDLYTNGDRLTDALLAELKNAGLDAVRFNLVAREFDTEPVQRALRYFDETAVEVPVIPERLAEMKEMVLRLDALGVPFLNIHELFACRENAARVAEHGYGSGGGASGVLLWEPVAEGDEAALSLLLFALENTAQLSAYYCSCRTQQDISRRGMRRRLRLAAST
ncbi:MAG TPA: radical SAM protein [Casimicrobiaceae bacterium]|nr:radical SAM protein [Casimicrobiaceae bacterium]